MIALLQVLEPIHMKPNTIIFTELDDVNEVIFIEEGFYDVGYEVNKKVQFKVRHPQKTVIGAFEACFNRRSLFIYKTHKDCSGFSVRKRNWHALETQHSILYQHIKRKALFFYIQRIRRPLLEQKNQDIRHYQTRADYKQVLYLRNIDNNEIQKIVEQELAKSIYEKECDEILIVKDIEKRIDSYQRYLLKVIKNQEQAHDVFQYLATEHEDLLSENSRLREMAKDKNIDIDAILQGSSM